MSALVSVSRLMGRRSLTGPVAPAWVLANASLDLDFFEGQYWDGTTNTIGNIMTTARSTVGLAQAADLTWSSFAINAPRITTLGLLGEVASTNTIRNNSMVGATVGIIGVGGALPTNWSLANIGTLVTEIVATGTLNGLPYVDIHISGVTSTTSHTVLFETSTNVAAVSGQTWLVSQFLALVAGSSTNITSFNSRIIENNSGGTALVATNTVAVPTGSAFNGQRFQAVRTFNQATAAFAQCGLQVIHASAATIDYTLRVGAPQLEQQPTRTTPILTTTVAVARAADTYTITGTAAVAAMNAAKSAYSNQGSGVLFSTANVICNFGSALLQISVANKFQTNNGTLNAEAQMPAGNVSSIAQKVAYGFDGTNLTCRINGGTLVTTAAVWGASGTIQLCNNAALTRAIGGYLKRFAASANASNFDSLTT